MQVIETMKLMIFGGLQIGRVWIAFFASAVSTNLSSFTTDSSRELDVFRYDCKSLGIDRAQNGFFEQADQVALTGFLQGHDCCALESQISLKNLSDFTDKSLERQISDQQLSWLLISSDFSQSDCSWSVSVRFFQTTSWGSALAGCLRCQLLSGSFTTSTLSCSLLRSCHLSSSSSRLLVLVVCRILRVIINLPLLLA